MLHGPSGTSSFTGGGVDPNWKAFLAQMQRGAALESQVTKIITRFTPKSSIIG